MRMTQCRVRRYVRWSAVAALMVCGSGCVHQPVPHDADRDTPFAEVTDGSLSGIRQRGELRIGLAPVAPFAMSEAPGTYRGFDIDLAARLAEDLGVKLTFAETPLCSLMHDLREGKFDLVLSGFTITPERALFVNFTNSISALPFVLVRHVTPGSHTHPAKPERASAEKVKGDEKEKIGAVTSTVAEAVAREQFPNAALVSVDTYEHLLSKLAAGELQGAVLPSAIALAAAASNPERLEVVDGPPLSTRPEAIAVRRGDRDLHDYLNSWITFYRSTGWLEERHHFWFDRFEWAAPRARK